MRTWRSCTTTSWVQSLCKCTNRGNAAAHNRPTETIIVRRPAWPVQRHQTCRHWCTPQPHPRCPVLVSARSALKERVQKQGATCQKRAKDRPSTWEQVRQEMPPRSRARPSQPRQCPRPCQSMWRRVPDESMPMDARGGTGPPR